MLREVDAPTPEPGPGQLTVRTLATAANFPDVLMCRGLYQVKPDLPFTPGVELCGEVVALGEGVEGFTVGQRVLGGSALPHGGFAEYALANAGADEPDELKAFDTVHDLVLYYDDVLSQLGVERFVSAQNHYNLLDRRAELEVVPAAAEFGLGVLPYFPLANGLLTGKYSQGDAPEGSRLSHVRQHMVADADLEQLAAFGRFARERGITEVQAAIGWLAAQGPVSSVIAGATRAAQVVENAAAADWLATAEDLAELDALFPGPEKVALF